MSVCMGVTLEMERVIDLKTGDEYTFYNCVLGGDQWWCNRDAKKGFDALGKTQGQVDFVRICRPSYAPRDQVPS